MGENWIPCALLSLSLFVPLSFLHLHLFYPCSLYLSIALSLSIQPLTSFLIVILPPPFLFCTLFYFCLFDSLSLSLSLSTSSSSPSRFNPRLMRMQCSERTSEAEISRQGRLSLSLSFSSSLALSLSDSRPLSLPHSLSGD